MSADERGWTRIGADGYWEMRKRDGFAKGRGNSADRSAESSTNRSV